MQDLGIPFLLKMQHEVLFSPHCIGDILNIKAECVKDSLICRKYLFLAKTFALRSLGIHLVPSPPMKETTSLFYINHCFPLEPSHGKTKKMICMPSEDSDQSEHPPSLIRIFNLHFTGSQTLNITSCHQRRL